jgi:hypothetical protein
MGKTMVETIQEQQRYWGLKGSKQQKRQKYKKGNLQDLYSPPNIMVIKLWEIRWMGHMRRERQSFVGKT